MNNNLKHIDINLLMDIFGGDQEIICDSIKIFSDVASDYYSTIIEAYNHKEWLLVGETSHKAKASCRTMGMTKLGKSFENIEKNSKGLIFQILKKKKELNKEEEKLFNSLQKSGYTQGNEKTINKEISLIKSIFHEAVNEIIKIEQELHQ